MDPTQIFSGIEDFRQYTEGLTADTVYDQLKPSVRTVASDIKSIITAAVFEAVASYGTGSTESQLHAAELLRTALASGAMAKYQIFASTKKNGSDASLYKYQHEEIKEHYTEAQSRAMDELLDWLDDNDVAGWHDTDRYKERMALPIRSAREFDRYFGIAASSFFFAKIQYLMRSTWLYRVKPLLSRTAEHNTVEIMEMAMRILAYRVMAQAVMQFDLTELPRSVRWDYTHEYTKGSEPQSRDRLAGQLNGQAASWEESLSSLVRSADGASNISASPNEERNKFFVML